MTLKSYCDCRELSTRYTYAENAPSQWEGGWDPVPLHPGTKKPIYSNWSSHGRLTAKQIEKWINHHPDANIGWLMGPRHGAVCLDIDPRNDGLLGLDMLCRDFDLPDWVPDYFSQRGGPQKLFQLEADLSLCHISSDYPGVDVIAGGGQVVVPPSRGEYGPYRLNGQLEPLSAHQKLPTDLLDWLLARQLSEAPRALQSPRSLPKRLSSAAETNEFIWLLESVDLPIVEREGQNPLVHCPWHDDRTPSLSINTAGSVFRCFAKSCGVHGGLKDLRELVANADSTAVDVKCGGEGGKGRTEGKSLKREEIIETVNTCENDEDETGRVANFITALKDRRGSAHRLPRCGKPLAWRERCRTDDATHCQSCRVRKEVNKATGEMSVKHYPCGSLHCPDCGPAVKQAKIAQCLELADKYMTPRMFCITVPKGSSHTLYVSMHAKRIEFIRIPIAADAAEVFTNKPVSAPGAASTLVWDRPTKFAEALDLTPPNTKVTFSPNLRDDHGRSNGPQDDLLRA